MSSRLVKLFILLALSLTISQASNARFKEAPRLGINVGSMGKLSSSIPFTDIFKISRGWFTSCEYDWRSKQPIDPGCEAKKSLNSQEQKMLDLDGNGWVRSLPRPEDAPIFTSVTSTWNLSDHFPTGRYVVLYDGEGRMKITGDLRMGYQRKGHIEFDLLSPKRNLKLQILQTDPGRNGNYIRNIRIIPKKNEHDYMRRVFNPDYIARIRPMHVLRFMPWTNPRANIAEDWSQRASIGASHYTGDGGVPAERMVDLANAINASPWLSIPYKANDNYVREYARMVKKRLRRNQKVYLEYSNEVWNSIFPAATYAARKADKLWKFPYPKVAAGKRRVLLSANWYAKRSVEMCKIWKNEFGAERNRVKCVLGSLNSVSWLGKEILDCPLWKEARGCGRYVDAFGIGPYFGDYIAKKDNRATVKSWTRDPDGGKSRLFQEILHGGMLEGGPEGGAMKLVRDQIYANKKLADKYRLELIAYEAGQHLIRYDPPHTVKDPAVLNLFMSVQKDPRMRQAYQQYLETWAQGGGGLILHFYGIGQPEPKNFFGMLDHLQQQTTPKYQALMDYLGSNITYVPPPQKAYAPPPAVRQQRQVQQPPRQQQAPRRQPQQAPRKNALNDVWNEFSVVPEKGQPSQQRRQVAPPSVRADYTGPIVGAGINGWTVGGNTATSPQIHLGSKGNYKLSVYWRFTNAGQSPNEFFRIYAIDSRGGRKLLINQPAQDIAEVGNNDQLYEEDISRYVGPPIRFMFETSPGLQAIIERVTF